MKTTILLTIAFLTFSFSTKQKDVYLEISKDRIVFAFTKWANIEEIEKAKNRLKEEAKINISFEENDDEISLKVDCQDGFKGNYAEKTSEYSKKLGNSKKMIGFYRIYSKNEKSPFGVGKISKELLK
jgi:hypothetical protein